MAAMGENNDESVYRHTGDTSGDQTVGNVPEDAPSVKGLVRLVEWDSHFHGVNGHVAFPVRVCQWEGPNGLLVFQLRNGDEIRAFPSDFKKLLREVRVRERKERLKRFWEWLVRLGL